MLTHPKKPLYHPVKDVFPNFSLFVYGGVNYAPYRARMEALIGARVPSVELFPASEGFIAYQDKDPDDGLLLVLDNGIYYGFLPMNGGAPGTRPLSIDEVQLGVNYALVLYTNAGLWGYEIGDTVRFTSLSPPRVVVTGRTKHYTSAFGERHRGGGGERLACRHGAAAVRGHRVHPGATVVAYARAPLSRVVHPVRRTAA